MQLGRKLQNRLIASVLFGLLVYIALAIFGDVRSVAASLKEFDWVVLPVIFLLALLNYALRFLRWAYYLRVLSIRLPLSESVTIFMSGLAMSISPGKMGEVVKSYFLKQTTGTPIRRSVSIVFAERFTDFASIVILAAVGAFSFQYGQKVIWAAATVTLVTLLVVMIRPLAVRAINLVSRLPRLRRIGGKLHDVYENAYTLLGSRHLLVALALGIASWFCECVGYLITAKALGFDMSLWTATFIYAFSTLFGAITLLPGGLGTTEGSLTGLAIVEGMPRDAAAAATIVIRVATLWFAVALGLLWMARNRDRLIPDRATMESEMDG